MAELGFYKNDSFLTEQWAEFGVSVAIIFVRLGVRLRMVGARGFQGDDYLAFLALALLTMDGVTVHFAYERGTSLDVPSEILPNLTPAQHRSVESGMKFELAAWYSYTALIWVMKGKMLFLYKRLTLGLWQSKAINYLAVLCALTYVAVFLTVTLGCRPMSDNWRVYPPPPRECGFHYTNVIVTCVFNVLTDMALLFIPIPLLWRVKTSLSRKIIIGMFLSSGVFVIAASIIRTTLTLGSEPSTINLNRWGIRETVVGVATVNLPILRPLFTKRFWIPGMPGGSSSGNNYYGHHASSGNYNLTARSKKTARNDSTTGINTASEDGKDDNGVYVSTTYNVQVENRGIPEAEPADGQRLGLNPSSVWEIDKKSMV